LKLFTLALSLVLTAPTIGRAQNPARPANQLPEATEVKFTLAGKRSFIRDFYSVNLDCSPVDWTEVNIVEQPAHGTAGVASRETQMFYADPNPRKVCTGKAVKSRVVTYQPNADYAGEDGMVVETINSEGFASRIRFNIIVRKGSVD
jgi:hypothetical protein